MTVVKNCFLSYTLLQNILLCKYCILSSECCEWQQQFGGAVSELRWVPLRRTLHSLLLNAKIKNQHLHTPQTIYIYIIYIYINYIYILSGNHIGKPIRKTHSWDLKSRNLSGMYQWWYLVHFSAQPWPLPRWDPAKQSERPLRPGNFPFDWSANISGRMVNMCIICG